MTAVVDHGCEASRHSPKKIYLQRIHINSGGYDSGGTYWGSGQPLYLARSEDGEIHHFFRAQNRDAAKRKLCADIPDAQFFR